MKDTGDKPPFVMLEWNDAAGASGWHNIKDTEEDGLAQVFTIGILIKETEEYYHVAQSVSPSDEETLIDNTTLVPKVNVVSIEQLITDNGGKKCQEKPKTKNQTKKKASRSKRKIS